MQPECGEGFHSVQELMDDVYANVGKSLSCSATHAAQTVSVRCDKFHCDLDGLMSTATVEADRVQFRCKELRGDGKLV